VRREHKLDAVSAFQVKTPSRVCLVEITEQVSAAVAVAGVGSGFANIFIPHTTAAVIVSENWDPDVTSDLLGHLEQVVAHEGGSPMRG
jgi:secondary thiamine-phosphate synthase enzyme